MPPSLATSADIVSSLEPLAGLGFAVCLAYLGLDPFRYRSKVETPANKYLVELTDPSDRIGGLDHYRWMLWFAGKGGEHPEKLLGYTYGILYKKNANRIVIFGLTAVAVLVLVAGVALKVGLLAWLSALSQPTVVAILFYLLTASLIPPLVLILVGRKCVASGERAVARYSEQVALALRNDLTALQPPPAPPGFNGLPATDPGWG